MIRLKRSITIFSVALSAAACSDDSSFIETKCEAREHGALFVQFASDQAIRTISIAPNENLLVFKGTTYNDMKWISEMSKVAKFVVHRDGMFSVKFKNGKQFQFGKISDECKKLTEGQLGALLQVD